jgi:chromosome segregation ATPase
MSETNQTSDTEKLKMEQNVKLGHNKFQKEIEELKLELDKVKQLSNEKDIKISDLEKVKTTLEKNVSDLKSQCNESDSSKNEKSKKLEEKLSEYEKLLQQEKQKSSDLSDKLKKTTQEVTEFKQVTEKYKKLLVDHDSLQKKFNSSNLSELNKNKELELNKNVIGNLKSEKDTLVILVEKLEKEIEELKRIKTNEEDDLKLENLKKDKIIEELLSKLENSSTEQKKKIVAYRSQSKSTDYVRGKRRMVTNKNN